MLLTFAVAGVWRWSQSFSADPPDLAPDAALDALARRHFALPDGAATIRRELASFPPGAPLLVFGPGDDWTLTEAHFLLSYLAWPRPVWCAGVGGAGAPGRFDFPPPPGFQPAGFFFYKIAPPAGLPGRALSERLALGKSGS